MTSPPIQLWPAIDIQAGRAVRLTTGTVDPTQVADPIALAEHLVAQGATALHVVDLDAAFGGNHNFELLGQVIKAVPVPVQLSGGMVTAEHIHHGLALGAARINVSAVALLHPARVEPLVAEFTNRLSLAIDLKEGVLAPRGTGASGAGWPELQERFTDSPIACWSVTDVDRDGALSGPPMHLLEAFLTTSTAPVVASGGIRSTTDIIALRELGVQGLIIGKALSQGSLTMPAALAAAGPQPIGE